MTSKPAGCSQMEKIAQLGSSPSMYPLPTLSMTSAQSAVMLPTSLKLSSDDFTNFQKRKLKMIINKNINFLFIQWLKDGVARSNIKSLFLKIND